MLMHVLSIEGSSRGLIVIHVGENRCKRVLTNFRLMSATSLAINIRTADD